MATLNKSVTLFNAQGSDTTGSANSLSEGVYALELTGDLGSGTFKLQISFDNGTTYSNYLLNGDTALEQTILGYSFIVSLPMKAMVKGVLTGSTSPSLTVKLHYNPGISYKPTI